MVTYEEASHWALVHQVMLADKVRMEGFQQALKSTVRPGDVVADIGTGTGIMALLALQAGAARVYAIDHNPAALWLAHRIARANNADHNIIFLEADASTVELQERVDVIVCEMIGTFGTDEGIFEVIQGFANRNLKPDGRIIPSRLQTYLAAVEYCEEFRGVWQEDFMGLDLRAGVDYPSRSHPLLHFLRYQPVEVSPPAIVEDLSFGPGNDKRPGWLTTRMTINRNGTLQGFVGYFIAKLIDGITLMNYPCYSGCNWNTWNWPVSPPLAVRPGQFIEVTLLTSREKDSLDWQLCWELQADCIQVDGQGDTF